MRGSLPAALFIGFAGKALELEDKSTRWVFDDWITFSAVHRAGTDGATVPAYSGSRPARLNRSKAVNAPVDNGLKPSVNSEERLL